MTVCLWLILFCSAFLSTRGRWLSDVSICLHKPERSGVVSYLSAIQQFSCRTTDSLFSDVSGRFERHQSDLSKQTELKETHNLNKFPQTLLDLMDIIYVIYRSMPLVSVYGCNSSSLIHPRVISPINCLFYKMSEHCEHCPSQLPEIQRVSFKMLLSSRQQKEPKDFKFTPTKKSSTSSQLRGWNHKWHLSTN